MGPLKGIKVLDLSRVLAGPYCTMMMADFGADVIKIEPPKVGDDSRAFTPFLGSESAYFMSLNRNKRSMSLDFKNPKHCEIFKEMVKQADVVVENYRPGTMEKFGLGWDVLKEINPRLIYAACSGFGRTGPYTKKPAASPVKKAVIRCASALPLATYLPACSPAWALCWPCIIAYPAAKASWLTLLCWTAR